jgi:hypothetical protein
MSGKWLDERAEDHWNIERAQETLWALRGAVGREKGRHARMYFHCYSGKRCFFSLVKSVGKVRLHRNKLALLKTGANRSSVTRWWFKRCSRVLLQLSGTWVVC